MPPWCRRLVLSCRPGASLELSNSSFPASLVPPSLVPPRLSNWSFPASLVPPWSYMAVPFLPPWCLAGCPNGPFASLVPPWCLPGCPMSPFLPPRCLAGCPSGPFLPPWCLPGASCLLGASQAVLLAASQAVGEGMASLGKGLG